MLLLSMRPFKGINMKNMGGDFLQLFNMIFVDFSIRYAGFGSRERYRRLNGAIALRKNRISAHMEPWGPKIHRFVRFQTI